MSMLEPDSAINGKRSPGDVIRIIGDKEDGRLADIFRRTEPAPGKACARLGHECVAEASCSPGVSIQPGSITLTLIRCG